MNLIARPPSISAKHIVVVSNGCIGLRTVEKRAHMDPMNSIVDNLEKKWKTRIVVKTV
jgi:hypothetical protein